MLLIESIFRLFQFLSLILRLTVFFFQRCISNYQGVYMNSKTLDCTRMAAAATIDLVEKIVNGTM